MSAILDSEPTLVTNAAWLPVPDMEPPLVADAEPVTLPVSLREIGLDTSLEIAFPEFGAAFGGPATVDLPHRVTSRITQSVDLVMELVTKLPASRAGPCTEATVEIRHRDAGRRHARDVFVTYTLFALLGLSRRVDLQLHIPGIEPLVSLDTSLSAASQYLQSRQLAYKLMVIEKATREEFVLPITRSAVEVATICFVYEAIVKRSFLWPDNYEGGVIRLPSSVEALNELLGLMQGKDLQFGPQPLSRTLFDKTIVLGVGTITVLDAVIEESDSVRAAIERGDVRDVRVRVRSLSGRIRYDLPDAPRISEENWDRNTQALVDIEPQLDAALFERYNALAAATLAGLTAEEKAQVTARVDFGAAFLPRAIGEKTLWRRLLRFLRFR